MASPAKTDPESGARDSAVLLTAGMFDSIFAKTAHGMVRGPCRYRLVGVIDAALGGRDAGEVLDGRSRGIRCFANLGELLETGVELPRWAVVAVATSGGVLPAPLRGEVLGAIEAGVGVVCGLHQLLADDPEIAAAARRRDVPLVDVRRAKKQHELHFWSGAIHAVNAPRVAVLGTDCAQGKRTTATMLVDACRDVGLRAELVYTGQTGWLQGLRWGFILDATPNDFVSGELENAIVCCDREAAPDVIFLEGQSSLRNPSGPCGAELLLSGGARGVVLQHAPGRKHFIDQEEIGSEIPSLASEIDLIGAHGAEVLAIAVHDEGIAPARRTALREDLTSQHGVPVAFPLHDGVGSLAAAVRLYLQR